MAELEEFLKELLVQAKRDSKAKLKSFVNNVEFDGDYPANYSIRNLLKIIFIRV